MAIAQPTPSSAWAPLRQPLFRALWIAAIASNIGTWMQNVGAAWLMTSLTPSPLLVALLQATTSLPVFLVGLPAGAIADIVDRRQLLLWTQGWMLVAAAGLTVLSWLDLVNAWTLLAFTFALGLGSAMNAPVWQAIIPELVPKSDLAAAVALNGVAFNAARAVGPAIAGLLVAAAGPSAVFLLNALSFLGVMGVIYRWQRPPRTSTLPTERTIGAIRAGVRYLRHAPSLQAVLIRGGVFICCGSALWALLPVVVRQELGLDAVHYGVLLGCMGLGAVIGAALLPKIRQIFSLNHQIMVATIMFAMATIALAYVREFWGLCLFMVAAGVAWVNLLSVLNVAAQTVVPQWVQARALGMYQLVFQGGMALSSIFWGAIAARTSIAIALLFAGLGLLVGLTASVRYRLRSGEQLDLAPALHWAEPTVVVELRPDDGPVLVTLEYYINPDEAQAFRQTMQMLGEVRQRDGAIYWGVCCDLADPSRYLETFVVESWSEHLRQHNRVTHADLEIEQQVRSFHLSKTPPKVSHLIYNY
ncbi:MFS transporter [Oscillatoria sp. FACHB-1407]|uniref:MFS transporter n=1 Tax=Oscillatoria sp. FACHB-1407 TaxID=2692847 RepID=UPI001687F175|nr:MFS transporter [Oscillatoria sp. FACHB-1407]MBD2465868.1 MFS transporter [Oscillatoria sp. FACHB-1407]